MVLDTPQNFLEIREQNNTDSENLLSLDLIFLPKMTNFGKKQKRTDYFLETS